MVPGRAARRSSSPIPPDGTTPAEAELQRRIAALEAERWRTFDDAQREADRVFAQYQLSQLLASGDTLTTMAEAVLEELLRHNGAARAALWLASPGRDDLDLVAAVEEGDQGDQGDQIPGDPAAGGLSLPRHFDAVAEAARWSEANDWSGVTLEESRDLGEKGVEQQGVGFVALAEGRHGPLEPDDERFLALIRHELAIAFRAAQLREILARERSVLSAILDGASEAIVAVDADRRVVRANVAALTLLGTGAIAAGTACEDVLGCRAPSSSPGAGAGVGSGAAADGEEERPFPLRCGRRCPFEEVLGGGAPVVYRERIVPGDGGDIPVAGSYALMSGTNAGAVAVLRDLRAGRAIDELKASFVAAVSHELRTPLALIGGYTETLLHLDLEPGQQREYVEKIRRASERLAGLVDDILEISRIESDRLTLDRRPIALADIVAGLAGELAESPDPPRLSLRIAPGLPLLDADPVRVAQILGNLVSNAAKYAGTGTEIRLAARRDGDVAIVTVQDDGPGIDPDEREHVFEQFYRGRRVRSTSEPGSGLGLYLCQRLVEAHGGRIWLDEGTTGTSISLTLPFVAARLRRTGRA